MRRRSGHGTPIVYVVRRAGRQAGRCAVGAEFVLLMVVCFGLSAEPGVVVGVWCREWHHRALWLAQPPVACSSWRGSVGNCCTSWCSGAASISHVRPVAEVDQSAPCTLPRWSMLRLGAETKRFTNTPWPLSGQCRAVFLPVRAQPCIPSFLCNGRETTAPGARNSSLDARTPGRAWSETRHVDTRRVSGIGW